MSISVHCQHCGSHYHVKDDFAGRRGRCPKCKQPLDVPQLAAVDAAVVSLSRQLPSSSAPTERAHLIAPQLPVTAQPSARPETRAEVLAQLTGRIEPVRSSLGYKLAMLLVAIVMVLLPAVYVGLIGGVGYLLYLHATHNTGIMTTRNGHGREQAYLLLLYLAPLVAGGILLLFMIKPLFARPVQDERRRSLKREGEPFLFAFVDHLCSVVGAPAPRRIDLNCQVNAAASLRRGLLSMFGSDLVLTIGLPLVAGLNLQQLAGVLAHEFGHFTQGWGMRLTYLIRTISFWFTRVVYQRDEWDARLVAWSEQWDYRIAIILWAARICIWLTRKVLWVLMMLGHAVAGILLREMEFDADMHEIRLGGSQNFESTCRRIAVLGIGHQGALMDLKHWYKEGRLGDDLPRLILANVDQLPGKAVAQINRRIDESKSGWFDTHPSDSQRIAQARQENSPGLFHSSRPATDLFGDFNAVAKAVTLDFYRGSLGTQLKVTDLHSTEQLLARQESENTATKSLPRYFQNAFHTLRPLQFPTTWLQAPEAPKAKLAELKEHRKQMLAALPSYRQAYQQFDQLDTLLLHATQAAALFEAGLKVKEGSLCRDFKTQAEAKKAQSDARVAIERIGDQLTEFERLAARRLTDALQLLWVSQVSAKIADSQAFVARANDVLAATAAIGSRIAGLIELRNQHAALGALLSNFEANKQKQKYVAAVLSCGQRQHQWIRTIPEALKPFRYPLDHARGEISLAQYCLERMPAADDLGAIANAASTILDCLPSLLVRLMAELTGMAEKVELVVGLPQLAEPVEEALTSSQSAPAGI